MMTDGSFLIRNFAATVSFRGGSRGCVIPDALTVQLYSRLAISIPDPILADHGEHSIVAHIKLEYLGSSTLAAPPATPRRQGIRELFSSGKFTDVTLSVHNVEFKTHMSLLASKCDTNNVNHPSVFDFCINNEH